MSKQKMIQSYEEADKALAKLGRQESFVAKKEAMLNERIQKLREKFDEDTTEERAQISLVIRELEEFCLINKADFLKKRSKVLTHGEIGFRTTPPKVSQLNRKYSLKTSVELIKKIFSGEYLRLKEEIDKERLLSDLSIGKIDDGKLASVGLKVDQSDTFVCEINWESLNTEAA